MLRDFAVSGKDVTSDSGRWLIILKAESIFIARKLAIQHLYDQGRSDLDRENIEIRSLSGEILYSDVQCL